MGPAPSTSRPSAKCWLVRHGERIDETREADAWAARTHPSRYFDPPLTERGKAQAAVAAEALKSIPHAFAALYCSPQLRCLETAIPIAKSLHLKIVIVPGLSQCAKAIEMAGLEAMMGRFVHKLPPSRPDSDHASLMHELLPEIEATEEEVVETFEEAFHRLSSRHPGQHIVLVTHREGVRLLGIRCGASRWQTPYCCISQFFYGASGDYAVGLIPTEPGEVLSKSTSGWDVSSPKAK